jgi:hypothetical protein
LETNRKGILICGSGQGMDRVANRIPGIYAAVYWDEISAKLAKEHRNVNVLCFGGRTVKSELTKKMVKIWLETPFIPEERHVRRINKIKKIEEKYIRVNDYHLGNFFFILSSGLPTSNFPSTSTFVLSGRVKIKMQLAFGIIFSPFFVSTFKVW